MPDNATLERPPAELRHRLRDFYEDYGLVLDEGEAERWIEFFEEDCLYKATSRENHDQGLPLASMSCDGIGMIRDRIMALLQTAVFEPRSLRHFIGPVRVLGLEPDGTIRAQANYLVVESMAHREPRLFSSGRYISRIVPRGESFRFREQLAVYDNYRVYTSLIWPL